MPRVGSLQSPSQFSSLISFSITASSTAIHLSPTTSVTAIPLTTVGPIMGERSCSLVDKPLEGFGTSPFNA